MSPTKLTGSWGSTTPFSRYEWSRRKYSLRSLAISCRRATGLRSTNCKAFFPSPSCYQSLEFYRTRLILSKRNSWILLSRKYDDSNSPNTNSLSSCWPFGRHVSTCLITSKIGGLLAHERGRPGRSPQISSWPRRGAGARRRPSRHGRCQEIDPGCRRLANIA